MARWSNDAVVWRMKCVWVHVILHVSVIASQVAWHAKVSLMSSFCFFLLCSSCSVSLRSPLLSTVVRHFVVLIRDVIIWLANIDRSASYMMQHVWLSVPSCICFCYYSCFFCESVSTAITKATVSCVCNWSLTSQTSWKQPLPHSLPLKKPSLLPACGYWLTW